MGSLDTWLVILIALFGGGTLVAVFARMKGGFVGAIAGYLFGMKADSGGS